MAPNIWDNETADGKASTVLNWSEDRIPTGADVMTFDDATSSTNCLFDVDIFCGGCNVTSGYSGNVDMDTFDLTTSGDMTFAGTGIFDCGTGRLPCSGNFDNKDQFTWIRGTSTVVMDGVSTILTSHSSNDLYSLTINENVLLSASTTVLLDVQGVLTVASGKTFTLDQRCRAFSGGSVVCNGKIDVSSGEMFNTSGSVSIPIGGEISGLGSVICENGTVFTLMTGTFSPASCSMLLNVTLAAGIYDSPITALNSHPSNRAITFAGDVVFPQDISFIAQTAFTYKVDLVTSDVSVEFRGNVTFTESGGGVVLWDKATTNGIVTFDGTTTYTDSSGITQDLGDVEVSGALTLASDMDCVTFSGLNGGSIDMGGVNYTLDASEGMDWGFGFYIANGLDELAGATFHTSGAFTADGQDIGSATGTWELQAEGGSAVAIGVGSVKNCDARGQGGAGGVTIDASAGPWLDNGGPNQNWDFGVVATTSPWNYYAQQAAIVG